MIANIITISRLPLLFIYLWIMYLGGPDSLIWNVPFILAIIILDSVDGWIARKRGETSLLGSVLDIAADRSIEYILWVVFADLDLISIAVPIIILIRGTAVDSVRSIGMKHGISAFDQIQSPINRFLVSSRFMRALYGTAKAAAFGLLTLAYAMDTGSTLSLPMVKILAAGFTWISVALCLLRGIPVLIEAGTNGMFKSQE
jgi:CDP-diacylglycerol--glycerol-3-phosphate 3-phosphatidyltransferase